MKSQLITINNNKLNVEVALTSREQARGLMNVDNLPSDKGLLFCYPRSRVLSFWMRNTTIPLSIAFIDKNKKITQIEDLKPLDEKSVKSNKKCMWALEVNKGWFDKHNVKVGDSVEIPFNPFKGNIKIRVLKLPPEAKQLAKTIEDKLVDMTMSALKTKLSTDSLKSLNIDVEVE